MNISTEQIKRFFQKQCTSEEAAQVAVFLKENPDVLNTYLNEAEWNEAETDKYVDNSFWDEAWEAIKRERRHAVAVVWLQYSAVAACVAGLLSLGYFVFLSKNDSNPTSGKKVLSVNIPAAVAAKYQTIRNTSRKSMHVLLQDG